MDRRDFLRLATFAATAAVIRVPLFAGAAEAAAKPVSANGLLYKTDGTGKIFVSATNGKTWTLHSNLVDLFGDRPGRRQGRAPASHGRVQGSQLRVEAGDRQAFVDDHLIDDRPDVSLRPSTPEDRDFLRAVYASTREEELRLVPWSDADKSAFVLMQFDAQDRAYHATYPDGRFLVVMVGRRRSRAGSTLPGSRTRSA